MRSWELVFEVMVQPLPIDASLPDLLAAVRQGRNVVLTAEPGAGKTTRVPRALLDAGLLDQGACWILEPRRLAARLAAVRVAEELGEEVGGRVGYAVRFEQKVSRETRIRFVTEGLLLRRMQEDPGLSGIAIVILDELHERHLHTDLALMLLKQLQKTRRKDLRILAMSATLDARSVAAYLDAEAIHSEGRQHPVEIQHAQRLDDRPLAVRVREALERVYAPVQVGHTLVFLPGAAEIRQCLQGCASWAQQQGIRLLPLHGSLSFEAQKQAVAPSGIPKVILSTNVAESSVTLDGVQTVIDSGLGREAVHSSWSGLSSLRTLRISQARCVQRAGRAGRLGPGRCIRLFTEAEFKARPAFDAPEILRADLTEPVMRLHAMGLARVGALDWFEVPPGPAVEAAESLLRRLGALDAEGLLTPCGQRMAQWPLHPRLARLVLEGEVQGIPDLACLAAAVLETGDLSVRTSLSSGRTDGAHGLTSDLWGRLDAYHEVEAAGFSLDACRNAGLDPGQVRKARLAYRALRGKGSVDTAGNAEERLLSALLRAYPDRVARSGGAGTYALLGGGGAKLDARSRVRHAEHILALEAEEEGREVRIRMASRLEPEWILEAFPEAIRDTETWVYHDAQGRVEQRSGLWYEDLCLDETRRTADPGDPRTANCLADALMTQDWARSQETLEKLLDRASFLSRHRPDLAIPERTTLLKALLAKGCLGCATAKEVAASNWGWILAEVLGVETARSLDALAPETFRLRHRKVIIHYDQAMPWVEARLQDFFGMKQGPTLLDGALPVVLHLLAPNNRAVQVTTDLAGFWQRTYRELRPQLSRRYPKHAWPEDPLAAKTSQKL